MNGRFLLDTNVIIALLNGEEVVTRRFRMDPEAYLPVIAVGELYYGAHHSARVTANVQRLDELTTMAAVLVCDKLTAQYYGRIKNLLRSKGRPVPDNDLWIAAISQQHGLTLISRDQHFSQIEGLAWETWQ
jgi:tRNA(fMet)-specific endonuclease VapC